MSAHLFYVLRFVLIGAVWGHLARRAAPRLIGLRGNDLPFRWPWLEALSALTFGIAAMPAGFSASQPAVRTVLAALLVATVATDVYRKILPDVLTFGGTIIGLGFSAWRPEPLEAFLSQWLTLDALHLSRTLAAPLRGLVLALVGAAAGYLLLNGFRLLMALATGVDGLGGGDAKLLMMIGAFLGPHAMVLSLLPACAIGTALGVIHRLRTGEPHVAFGPALAGGAFVTLVAGDALLELLWRLSLWLLALPIAALIGFYAFLLTLLAVVLLRLRRRSGLYNQMLDDDFAALEAELEGDLVYRAESTSESAGESAGDPSRPAARLAPGHDSQETPSGEPPSRLPRESYPPRK
jgi:leader peptidase (prepilin peptidase)/N-methyltransferase